MKIPFLLSVLVGIALAGGCTSPPDSATSAERPFLAGAEIVHSSSPQWEEGEAWSVSLEPHLTIGVLDGAEEYQFVDVGYAARRSDGSLVIADRGTRSVRLYGPDGSFLKTLGGPGSGPGEFQNPGPVLVTSGDSVAVWDGALYRITRFDPSGELTEVRPLDIGAIANAVDPPLYPGEVDLLAGGQFLVRLVEKREKAAPTGKFRDRSGAIKVSEDLSVIDTLMFFPAPEQVTVDAPWGPWLLAPPQGKRTRITQQGFPPTICIGDQEGPEIACFGPEGGPLLLRWEWEQPRLMREDVTAWRETTIELYGQKLNPVEVAGMLDQIEIPQHRPHYSELTLDRAGNLWVELGASEGGASPSVDHLVFDAAGRLLGLVVLPAIEVLEIGDDYVVGVYQDEFEVEYVQVHRIRKGSNSAETDVG